jgi:hypothetical protein
MTSSTLAAHISRLESARLATESAMDAAGRSGDLAEWRYQRAELARVDRSIARMHEGLPRSPTLLGVRTASPGRYRMAGKDVVSEGYERLAGRLNAVIAEARAVLGVRS